MTNFDKHNNLKDLFQTSHIQILILTTRNGITTNSEIFVRILFLQIALKDIFCDVKNSLLGHGLRISINYSVTAPFCKDFYFHKTSLM